MSNMDSTYSPHSPDLTSILTSSPKAQQFSKPSISRQPYASRSPTVPLLASTSLDKNTFHYAPSSYATNLTSNSALSFNNSGELFPCDVRQTPLSIPSTGFPSVQNLVPMPPTHNTLSTYRGSREKHQRKSLSASMLMPQYADPNPQNIEIKTKFPVARIKRIMQADEEVGKVAQVTPVAVSKALELFMIALVTGAANKAREKGSKKVSAQHLKLVVDGQPERFDFLAEIVGRFGEGSENTSDKANRKRKEESESASDEEREKIKKRGRGRKKKSGD